jgi:hypothetical protein
MVVVNIRKPATNKSAIGEIMKPAIWFIVAAAVGAPATAAFAQAVYIESTARGMQAERLIYAIKEKLRASSTMRVVDNENDSALQIRVNAMDTDSTAYQAVYAVTWTFSSPQYPAGLKFYDNSTVGICGAQRIAECGDTLVAETDKEASDLRQLMKSALNSSK